MKPLALHLESATQYECVAGVTSFTGEDASGSFGILPGHAAFSTVLEFGLARFRVADGPWEYLAAPGAVLRVSDNELHFSTRRYLRDTDPERIRDALREQLFAEEDALHEMRQSLRRLEEEMLKRLWQLERTGEGFI